MSGNFDLSFEGSTCPIPESDGDSSAFFRDSDSGPESADATPLPERIGRYRILKRLGTGGMGEVFLALDESLSRRIAPKRVRPEKSAQDEFRRRFEIEARVTALLQHPSIIPVYHFETGSGDTFYTMRPVEGMTLKDLRERLRDPSGTARDDWPTARIVRLFLQATNAIAYAHSRGVIHRDLKPANIMIGPFEEVLVLDWGMAKFVGDEAAPPSPAAPAKPAEPYGTRTVPSPRPDMLGGTPTTASGMLPEISICYTG